MRKVYTASNTTEAHLIKNLLEQRGIEARVDGHYLQGGLGELPPVDVFAVRVADAQEAAARELIAAYDQGADQVDDETLERLAVEAPMPREMDDTEDDARWEASNRIIAFLSNVLTALLLAAAAVIAVYLISR